MNTPARKVVAVRFGHSEKTYDYFADVPVEVGQKVVVETRRGEAKVEVMAIKDSSDVAVKAILRVVEPEPVEEGDAA